MTADTQFVDESGESLTIKAAIFLRTEFGIFPSTGWPRNPPRILSFIDAAEPAGAPPHSLAAIVADVAMRYATPICFGIVNLDQPPDPNTLTYQIAGWGMDKQSTIGSCAKIWAMYAAFQLRDDVRSLILGTPGIDRSTLAAKLKASWRSSPIPELRNLARNGRMPRLDQIFDLSALPADAAAARASPAIDPTDVDIDGIADYGLADLFDTASTGAGLASQLATFHQHEYSNLRAHKVEMWEQLAIMPFGRRLWLTTAWSDNAAATTCILDIGLDYIGALLSAAHLYDTTSNAGPRLAETYATPNKLLDAGTWRRGTSKFTRISQFRYDARGKSNNPHQAATVRTLLCFATALDQRLLISAADSEQMLSLMRPLKWATGSHGLGNEIIGLDGNPVLNPSGSPVRVNGVSSFLLNAFEKYVLVGPDPDRPFKDAAAKIGIVGRKLADLAIVTLVNADGSPVLHWAVAFLANLRPVDADDFDIEMNQYGLALREIVDQWMA